MKWLIHFRSLYTITQYWWEKINQFSGRSMEIRWIRSFSPSDSTRDIAWKKSTSTERIFTKEYSSEGMSKVIFWVIGKHGWDFYTEEETISKKEFSRSLEYILDQSSHIFHFPLEKINEENVIQHLQKKQPKWSIILILSSSLQKEEWEWIEKLSQHNDVIILHIFHPVEINPSSQSIFFESKKVKYERYEYEFRKAKKAMDSSIKKYGISLINITPKEDISLVLNFFFKNRYAR